MRMKTILIVAGIFLVQFCGAQAVHNIDVSNAYLIAKNFRKIKTAFSQDFTINDSTKQFGFKLLAAIHWYADVDDYKENEIFTEVTKRLEKYEVLNTLYIDVRSKLLNRELIVQRLFLNKLINTLGKDINYKKTESFNKLFRYNDILIATEKKNVQLEADIRRLEKNLNDCRELQNKNTIDTIISFIDSCKVDENLKKIQDDQSTLRELEVDQKKIENKIFSFFYDNRNDIRLFKAIESLNGFLDNQYGWLREVKNYNDEVSIADQKFAKEKEASLVAPTIQIPSLQLPTQVQMIDALAIYLVKRVKQESVMWFFETIKKNAKQYDLIKTFFPNTITLLQGNEVYEIPNLGTQWRYALSKDFITMPTSVFESSWLKDLLEKNGKNYSEEVGLIKDAFKACALLNQNYSFDQMIKELFLRKVPGDDSTISGSVIFTALYAFKQEAFSVVKKASGTLDSVRLLNYEDLRNMNREELDVFLSLIDLKYKKVFSKILEKDSSKTFFKIPRDVEKLRLWFGKIETGIQQFRQVQTQFLKSKNSLTADGQVDMVSTVFNIWDNVNNLIQTVLKSVEVNEKLNKTDANMKKAFEIYNQISLRNYAGAVNTTIALIEEIVYADKKVERRLDFKDIKDYAKKIEDGQIGKRDKSLMVMIAENRDEAIKNFKKTIDKFKDENLDKKKEFKTKIIKVFGEDHFKKEELDNLIKGLQSDRDSVRIKSQKTLLEKLNKLSNQLKFPLSTEDLVNEQNSFYTAVLYEKDRMAVNLIRKLAGFLNDVILTTDPKQLSRVVASYAMPTGSYKRKRNSWYSLDFNAYVGAYTGVEKIKKADGKWAGVYGITAPIGLTFSKTFGREVDLTKDTLTEDFIRNPDKLRIRKNSIYKREGSTLSLIVTVVDLGAVVSYRFENSYQNDKGLPQDVKWSQLISPGLKLGWAIKNTPLILNAGYQYTPELRRLSNTNPVIYSASRWSAGLAFDLPLLGLWQKSHIKSQLNKKD